MESREKERRKRKVDTAYKLASGIPRHLDRLEDKGTKTERQKSTGRTSDENKLNMAGRGRFKTAQRRTGVAGALLHPAWRPRAGRNGKANGLLRTAASLPS